MSAYQPGIPTGLVNLDVDYQNIQNNFQQLDTTFGVDHTTFSNQTAQNGYHTAVHLIPVSTTATNPPDNQPINGYTATAGYGQVFDATINDGLNTDQALFFLTGGNRLMQLTRNFVPTVNIGTGNGYTFLPGGFILQWGSFNPNSSTTVTFAANGGIAFPNNVFTIQLTGANSTNTSFRTSVQKNSLTKTGFVWGGSVDGGFNPIYYWVIGN